MGIDTVQEYLGLVASIVTSLGILWVPVKLIYLDPREELKKANEKLKAKEEKEHRQELMDIRKREHQETLQKMEESSAPHIELLKQHNERINNLENQNKEHDGRILVLEKRNGIQTFGYVEKEGD